MRRVFLGLLILLSHGVYAAYSDSLNHVYTVGLDTSGPGYAAFWISNPDGTGSQEVLLPTLTSGASAFAAAVAVSDNSVYIAGIDDSGPSPVLWTSNLTGTGTISELQLPLNNDILLDQIGGIAVSDNSIYIIGDKQTPPYSGTLWICDLDNSGLPIGTPKEILLPTMTSGASANHVAVSGNSVYIVGQDLSNQLGAVLWISNLTGTSIQEIQLPAFIPSAASYNQASSVAISGNYIYSVGTDVTGGSTPPISSEAVLWINALDNSGSTTTGATKEIQLPIVSPSSSAFPSSVAVLGSSIYSAGYDGSSPGYAALWICNSDGTNAREVLLPTLTSGAADSYAYSVAVTSFSPVKVLVETLTKYSPFAPLQR